MRHLCFLSVTFVFVAVPVAWTFPKPDAESGKLELILTIPNKTLFSGDPFNLKFLWKNGDDRSVTLLRPLDGSECGWRKVSYAWEVTRDGKPLQRRGYGRCGNVNPLMASDFITLLPGKSSEIPAGFAGSVDNFFLLTEPGIYSIRMIYRFDPRARDKGEGQNRVDESLKQKLETMPLMEIASNPITVEVKPLSPELKTAKDRATEAETVYLTAWDHHNKLMNQRTGAAEHEEAIRKAKTASEIAQARWNELKAEFERLRKETDPSK